MDDPDRQVMSVFGQALECGSAEERAAYLARACGNDPELRAQVESLLAAHEQAGDFLRGHSARSTPASTTDEPYAEGPGTVIGPYKLVQEIGEGGMGTVWMAQQTEPVKRLVALKVIKPGMDSRQVIARFEAERQALALMDHPNIARVLDAGTTAAGRPYFVMELVKGVPLTKYCDEHRLTPRQRLELFIPVCQAIQHAHQKGIIHRDIKPSNVLVALYDGRPVPKVIDFGIAKATGQQLTERTLVTGFGAVVGTLEYMSPEQAELNQLDIDTRSDIYSLGVLLYELLTATTPLDRKRLKEAAMLELLRIIREEEPPKPSTRLSTTDELPSVAANRGLEPKKLGGVVRGELDWIVMKALEKDRNRRYATANGFAQDIQRYLADEPVQACPPSAWYRFRKFARRKKTALVIAACVFLALAGVAGTIGWVVRDRGAREEGIERERLAREAALDQIVEGSLHQADDLLESGSWPEAAAAIERADKLLRAAGRTERPPRLVQLEKDAVLAEHLEAIYRRPSPILRGKLISGEQTNQAFDLYVDWADEDFVSGRKPDAQYAEAFAKAGLDPAAVSVGEVAERIRAMRIRSVLVRALDLWSFMRRRAQPQGGRAKSRPDWEQLVDIAVAADPDPWRTRLREAHKRGDRQALAALAASPDISRRGPDSLFLLATALVETGGREQAIALARQAVLAYPEDWWLNSYLSRLCLKAQPPRYDEAICYATAAQAIRPRNPYNLTLLGNAWRAKKAHAEALRTFTRAIELKPDHAEAWFLRGLLLWDLKQSDKAITDFTKAIELAPKSVAAWGNRGLCYCQLGQYDRGIGDLNKAIELDPKEVHAWYSRGLAYNELRQYDKAVADNTKAIELDPKYVRAWINRGNDYRGLKQYDKAIADYSKAIELDASFVDANGASAWLNRGWAYYGLKQYDKAVADYTKAIDLDPKNARQWHNRGNAHSELRQYDKAVADQTKAIELDPKFVQAWINRGTGYYRLKQYDKAIADYSRAIELDPSYVDPSHTSAWLNRGSVYGLLRQYDKAVADCTRAIDLDPKNASAWLNRGRTYHHLTQCDKAVADFSKAIELNPKEARAWNDRGSAYGSQGQYDKAIADYTKAINLDRMYTFAWYNRGHAYRYLKQYDKAVADYSEAIHLDPKNASRWSNRGQAYCDLKQYDKAVADYSKAIDLSLRDARPHNALAWLLATCPDAKQRDPTRAVKLASRAIELARQDGNIWNTLGVAQYRAGNWKDAITSLEKSMQLRKGDNSSDWLFLAMAHWQLGEKEKARTWFDQAARWMDKNQPTDEELARFRTEAAELLGIKDEKM